MVFRKILEIQDPSCITIPRKSKTYSPLILFNPPKRSNFRNLCHMVGFPICVRDLPENEAKVPNFNANFDHQYLWLEMSF